MELTEIKRRMKNRQLYYCNDPSLMKIQTQCLETLYDFNQTRPSEQEKRTEILKKLFADMGENCYVEPPLHTNWGIHTHIGNDFYANFNLTLVDDTDIFIGDNVLIGPNVIIDTAGHPIRPDIRAKQAQFNIPVTIGNNVWIGAGAILLPGVTIGDNTVIGAGSIVTKDVPANVVAMGAPCRVAREIGERDMKYYYKDLEIDID